MQPTPLSGTTEPLCGRRILLGITGGIAAYKSAELLRLLVAAGAEVQVVMTAAAHQFITPLTLQALGGRPPRSELFDATDEAAMGHIELSRWADIILIAPATANLIARLRSGLADDLLSTLCLAAKVPLALAPAMNTVMWGAAATQENVAKLRQRGLLLWGPGEGLMACGETGIGRMLEPDALRDHLIRHFCPTGGALEGVKLLITAGPTHEALDPVRFIGNRSSGKMGYAMARAARQQGAEVTLVSGPVALPPPSGMRCVRVESAAQMHAAVLELAPSQNIFIGAAAVADYRPQQREARKIKKEQSAILELRLVRNPDILAEVAALQDGPFCVGFAAETHDPLTYAKEKLHRKGLDLIIANQVGGDQGGFDSDENQASLLWAGGQMDFPITSKQHLAQQLIDEIARHYAEVSRTAK